MFKQELIVTGSGEAVVEVSRRKVVFSLYGTFPAMAYHPPPPSTQPALHLVRGPALHLHSPFNKHKKTIFNCSLLYSTTSASESISFAAWYMCTQLISSTLVPLLPLPLQPAFSIHQNTELQRAPSNHGKQPYADNAPSNAQRTNKTFSTVSRRYNKSATQPMLSLRSSDSLAYSRSSRRT